MAQKWQERRRIVVWSVAGFDPSSGAGITADLGAIAAHGLFGCAAITALTVQNTAGVKAWSPVEPALLAGTLAALQDDLPAAGVKVGMLGTPAVAGVVAEALEVLRTGSTPAPPVVLDPVLRSSSGRALYPEDHLGVLHERVLPWVDWVTPNWVELALLSGIAVSDNETCELAARALGARHPHLHVVATGGDQRVTDDLLLLPGGEVHRFAGERVETRSTHGTGCAFSSALLAACVLGATPVEAVRQAKRYVEQALRLAPGLGQGRGPLELLWPLLDRPPEDETDW